MNGNDNAEIILGIISLCKHTFSILAYCIISDDVKTVMAIVFDLQTFIAMSCFILCNNTGDDIQLYYENITRIAISPLFLEC